MTNNYTIITYLQVPSHSSPHSHIFVIHTSLYTDSLNYSPSYACSNSSLSLSSSCSNNKGKPSTDPSAPLPPLSRLKCWLPLLLFCSNILMELGICSSTSCCICLLARDFPCKQLGSLSPKGSILWNYFVSISAICWATSRGYHWCYWAIYSSPSQEPFYQECYTAVFSGFISCSSNTKSALCTFDRNWEDRSTKVENFVWR